MKASIFDIQRYSSHDGPGIRTTVFFKGCGLRCKWCHNPESFVKRPDLLYRKESCIGCGLCQDVCPQGVHVFPRHRLNRELCVHCGKCAELCPCNALENSGREYAVDEVFEVLKRDMPFYESSGGGVTLSGGEVLLQADFAAELLKKCKEEGLHTTVDTAGFVPYDAFEKVLPYTNLFLYDIKAVTPELHREATGQDNAMILNNYKKLLDTGKKIWVRIPVIPGYTESEEELHKIGLFLREHTPDSVDLLRFHRLAESKYRELGAAYPMGETVPPTLENMEEYRTSLAELVTCEIRLG